MYRERFFLFSLYLVSLLAVFFFIYPSPDLFAVDLPSDGDVTLSQILQGKEFQPRREVPTYWENLTTVIKEWIAQILKRFDFEHGNSEYSNDFLKKLAKFILGIWGVIADSVTLLLGCAIVILVVYFGRTFFTKLILRNTKSPLSLNVPHSEKSLNTFYVNKMLSSGALHKALEYVRSFLRERYLAKYALLTSKTDREVLTFLPSDEQDLAVFADISGHFEKIVFAAKKADPEAVKTSIDRAILHLEVSQ